MGDLVPGASMLHHPARMFARRSQRTTEDDSKEPTTRAPRTRAHSNEDARRLLEQQHENLRHEADRRGVAWKDLIDRAQVSQATRSRLNHGTAGVETLGRLQRALDELAGPSSDTDAAAATSREDAAAQPAQRRRWVVVQRRDRQIFVGITAATDAQVANNGYVRLDRCRQILSSSVSAAALAAVGPSQPGVADIEAPSALILHVEVIFDATKVAVKALESRK